MMNREENESDFIYILLNSTYLLTEGILVKNEMRRRKVLHFKNSPSKFEVILTVHRR